MHAQDRTLSNLHHKVRTLFKHTHTYPLSYTYIHTHNTHTHTRTHTHTHTLSLTHTRTQPQLIKQAKHISTLRLELEQRNETEHRLISRNNRTHNELCMNNVKAQTKTQQLLSQVCKYIYVYVCVYDKEIERDRERETERER